METSCTRVAMRATFCCRSAKVRLSLSEGSTRPRERHPSGTLLAGGTREALGPTTLPAVTEAPLGQRAPFSLPLRLPPPGPARPIRAPAFETRQPAQLARALPREGGTGGAGVQRAAPDAVARPLPTRRDPPHPTPASRAPASSAFPADRQARSRGWRTAHRRSWSGSGVQLEAAQAKQSAAISRHLEGRGRRKGSQCPSHRGCRETGVRVAPLLPLPFPTPANEYRSPRRLISAQPLTPGSRWALRHVKATRHMTSGGRPVLGPAVSRAWHHLLRRGDTPSSCKGPPGGRPPSLPSSRPSRGKGPGPQAPPPRPAPRCGGCSDRSWQPRRGSKQHRLWAGGVGSAELPCRAKVE